VGFTAIYYEIFVVGASFGEMLLQVVAGVLVVSSVLLWKLTRNKVEDHKTLRRSKYHVGPGLAVSYYRFLENIIKGKKGTPKYTQMLRNYKLQETIPNQPRDRVLDKVIILFPESDEEKGSVQDLLEKEKGQNSDHRLLLEKISYEYEVSGKKRKSEMYVVKVCDADKDSNVYVVIVENQPLNTLYNMVSDHAIRFTKHQFRIQFKIYMDKLRELLDSDKQCRGKYEIFHYKDDGTLSFSKALLAKINDMKYSEMCMQE